MKLDPIRLRVLELIEHTGTDLKKASLACGKNAAYVHQFIYRGTPKILPEDVRKSLAHTLGAFYNKLAPRRSASLRRTRRASTTTKRLLKPERPRDGQRSASRLSPKSTCAPRLGPARSTRGWKRPKLLGCSPTL
jgi:hypothetical protein